LPSWKPSDYAAWLGFSAQPCGLFPAWFGIIRDAALCELCRHRHNGHSTGHSKRLDRKLDTDPKPFGSADYGREELIAEMAAAFLCGHVGIRPAVIENQAAYLQGWLKQLKDDKRLVIAAAGAAQKDADWIRGEHKQRQ
jgi:antirestriction protein ArdC